MSKMDSAPDDTDCAKFARGRIDFNHADEVAAEAEAARDALVARFAGRRLCQLDGVL